MPSETRRGCGYRKVGSLYLCGEGIALVCDMLPLELEACATCGFEIPFTRNLMKLNKQFIVNEALIHYRELNKNPNEVLYKCKCEHPKCPLCYPTENSQQYYGIMWVGEKYYTPDSFVKEAMKVGVSKKIPEIPKWLTLGETWVLLAHPKVPKRLNVYRGLQSTEEGLLKHELIEEMEYMKAIFYAFRPQRIEMPIWKKDATPEKLGELQKQGITPILIEDNDSVHKPRDKSNKALNRTIA